MSLQLSKIAALSAIVLSIVSCEKGPSARWPASAGGELVKLSFSLPVSSCKSSFTWDENTVSDWAVFIFNADGTPAGLIEKDGDATSAEIYVPRHSEYCFYILANLAGTIEGNKGYKALAKMNQEEFENLSFKVTTPNQTGGIAMAWVQKNYIAQGDTEIQINLKRLYAKYLLSISKDSLKDAEVSIKSVSIRQSKGDLYPFREENAGGMDDEGDRAVPLDLDILNEGGSIALYVPENIVGADVGKPEIEDQWDKDMEHLSSMGYEELCRRCTYLEIIADYNMTDRISPSQLRYFNGKTATWRFILGGDSTSDFDIESNTVYNLNLQLTDEGVFRNCWRAALDNYSGKDCLLRWESVSGTADVAHSIETVFIETPSSHCTVYPKLVVDGTVCGDASIAVSPAASPHISRSGKGYLICGSEDMTWQTITLTALWTDENGYQLESDLKIKIRPSNIGIDPIDTCQNIQIITF